MTGEAIPCPGSQFIHVFSGGQGVALGLWLPEGANRLLVILKPRLTGTEAGALTEILECAGLSVRCRYRTADKGTAC